MSLCGDGVLLEILLLLQGLEGIVPPKNLQEFGWKRQNNIFIHYWGVSIQTNLRHTGGKKSKTKPLQPMLDKQDGGGWSR